VGDTSDTATGTILDDDVPMVDSTLITVTEESENTPLGLTAPTGIDLTDVSSIIIEVTGLPTLGSVTLADGSIVSNGDLLSIAQLTSLEYDAPVDYTLGEVVGEFMYTLNNGISSPVTGKTTINVIPVNDAPIAVDDTYMVDEDGTVVLMPLMGDTDIEGPVNLVSINGVELTGGIQTITVPNGIVEIDGSGVITFIPETDYNGLVNFPYVIEDSEGVEASAIQEITVNEINDAPVAVDDTYSVNEGESVVLLPLTGDSDIEGPVSLVSINGENVLGTTQTITVPNGTVSINSVGEITFTPNTNYFGNVTFPYEIEDEDGVLASANEIITVNAVINAEDDVVSDVDGINGGTAIINVFDNDTFENNTVNPNDVTLTIVDADPSGYITLNPDGSVDMLDGTPEGTYSITYSICENSNMSNCDTAIVTVNVVCNSTKISGVVMNVGNNTPLANVPVTLIPNKGTTGATLLMLTDANGYYNFTGFIPGDYIIQVQDANLNTAHNLYNVDASLSFLYIDNCDYVENNFTYDTTDLPVLGNFVWYDLNNNGIQDEWFDANNDGVVTQNIPDENGVVDYSAWEWIDFNGDGSYEGANNEGELNAAGFSNTDNTIPNVYVTGPNGFAKEIIVGIQGYWRTRGESNGWGTYDVTFDYEAGIEAAANLVRERGLVKVLPNAVGAKSAKTAKSQTYTVCGVTNEGNKSTQLTATNSVDNTLDFGIICEVFNSAPIANTDEITANEDATITLNVTSNDTDSDGTIDVATVDLDPSTPGIQTTWTVENEGTYTVDQLGVVTFVPVADFNGVATPVEYTVNDNEGLTSEIATITVTVNPVNDDPVAVDDFATTNEDVPVIIAVLDNDLDSDGDVLTVTEAISTDGTVIINTDGTITFTPNPDFVGEAVVTYTITDENGATDVAIVTIAVEEDRDITITTEEVCIDDAPYVIYDITPVGFVPSEGATIIWRKMDGTIVSELNNQSLSGQLLWPGAVVDSNGVCIAWPGWEFVNGTWVEINDGLRPEMELVISLNPESTVVVYYPAATSDCSPNPNNAPVLGDDVAEAVENLPVSGNLLPNDSDLDGDELVLNTTPVTPPTNGTVVINPDGSYTYTPNADFVGTDSFVYEVCDNATTPACTTATVTITVLGDNDGDGLADVDDIDDDNDGNPDVTDPNVTDPIAVDDVATILFNEIGVIDILLNDDYLSSANTTLTQIGGNAIGVATFDPMTGEMTYTPDPSEAGKTVEVEYEVCYVITTGDSAPGSCESAKVSITIPEAADLVLEKVVNNTLPVLGEDVVFTITLANNGPSDATGVQILDKLPLGYTYVSHTTSVGSFDNSSGYWIIDTVLNGATETLVVTATVNSVNDYLNTAEVIAADQVDPTSVPGNKNPSEDDQAEAGISVVGSIDLSLTKTVVDGDVVLGAGTLKTFEIRVLNDGPSIATGVQVVDLLPSGYDYVGYNSTIGTYDPNSGLWNLGFIEPGNTAVLMLDVNVLAEGEYNNCAQITAANEADVDSVPNNDDATEDDFDCAEIVLLQELDLSIEKTVVDNNFEPRINDEVTFEIRLTNNGVINATSVQVEDVLPTGYSFITYSSTTGTYDEETGLWNVIEVEPGKTEVLLVATVVNEIGDYLNCATITNIDQIDTDSTNDSSCIELDPLPEIVLNIPEAFTPNGDGINDVFELEYLEVIYPNFKMEIVNRWGNKVYDYQHNGNAETAPMWWDGYSDGRWNVGTGELPVGTYFYTIYFNNNEREPLTGWVYLRR
ncbi:Ig-like domain-containing protein, partial [Lutibacter holmesii]